MNLKAMREALAKKLAQITALKGLESPTAEQAVELDALLTEGEQLKGQIEAAEATERRLNSLNSWAQQSANPIPAPSGAPTGGGGSERKAVVLPASLKSRKSQVFKSSEDAYAFGMYYLAVVHKHARATAWCKDHGFEIVRQAQTENDNTAGGYVVPSELGEIIESLIPEYGVVRAHGRIVPMSRDHMTVPKTPPLIKMRPMSELGTLSADTFRFGEMELTARKWGMFVNLSSEVSEDAVIAMADEIAGYIAKSAGYTEDDAAFMGDGTSAYHRVMGIFAKLASISSNRSLVTAGAGIDTYAEVTSDLLLTVKSRVNPAVWADGDLAWYCTSLALTMVFERLALTAGGTTAQEVLAGITPRYLGYPIRVTNGITDNEAAAGYALAFGSLRRAVSLGTRRELTIVNSKEAGFFTDSEYLRATERIDIVTHEPGTDAIGGAMVALKFAG